MMQQAMTPGAYASGAEHPQGFPLPMDMRDLLAFEPLIHEIPSINALNAGHYLREFLKAKELSNSFYSKATFEYERSRAAYKEEAAIAYLERAGEYIEKKGLKSTDEIRKQYVAIDPKAKAAKETEDYFKALVTLLEGKLFKFNDAHADVQLIFQKTREPMGGLSSLPSGPHAQ